MSLNVGLVFFYPFFLLNSMGLIACFIEVVFILPIMHRNTVLVDTIIAFDMFGLEAERAKRLNTALH